MLSQIHCPDCTIVVSIELPSEQEEDMYCPSCGKSMREINT